MTETKDSATHFRAILCGVTVLGCLAMSGCESDPTSGSVALVDGECPTNHWPPCSDLEFPTGLGYEVGDTSYIFQAVDQFRDWVDLRQFAGGMILIEVGATWCPPCRADATTAQAFLTRIREEHEFPFWRVTVFADRINDGVSLAQAWARDYELEFPCLAGTMAVHTSNVLRVEGFPTFLVLDPDLQIRARLVGHGGVHHEEWLEAELVRSWEAYQSEHTARELGR